MVRFSQTLAMSDSPSQGTRAIFKGAGPVDWALGKIFVHELGKTLLYYLLPDRVDARDWMEAKPLPLALKSVPVEGAVDTWFDFVADTGDTQCLMYAVA